MRVKKQKVYIDNGWPKLLSNELAISELTANRSGALSPFGDTIFPVPVDELPFIHSCTKINN